MLRRDEILMKDIIDSIHEALHIVEGLDFDDFRNDRIRQYAVIRLLEIIGEASNQASDDLKERNPSIPWKPMIAMRNRLIHGYFSVDPEIVWDTVRSDLPPLLKKLEDIH